MDRVLWALALVVSASHGLFAQNAAAANTKSVPDSPNLVSASSDTPEASLSRIRTHIQSLLKRSAP
jgi:hypothetical protein